MALPIYTHVPNLKGLTKIFFKLLRPKGNLCGGGVTILNPKYPRLLSGDTIIITLIEMVNNSKQRKKNYLMINFIYSGKFCDLFTI